MRLICKPSWLCLCLSYDVYFFYLVNAFVLGISNVKSREDLVMSGSDSSDPFEKAPFKKPGHVRHSSSSDSDHLRSANSSRSGYGGKGYM